MKPEATPTPAIICSADNAAEFNARLRSELPEAFALAKALHQLGMLDGLAGARLGPAGSLGGAGVVPGYSEADIAAGLASQPVPKKARK